MTLKQICLALAVAALAPVAEAVGSAVEQESHVRPVVARILDNVRKLRAADPEAVPMAFWDFDGTIICGDSGIGYVEDGVVRYKGLIEEVIDAGFLPISPRARIP